jgi:hypothetical protein
MVEPVNVICMKWGTKYPAEYVNKLYSMVQRHLTLPHRFICLTDDKTGIRPEVECFDLPVINVPQEYDYSPWRKLGMFSANLANLKGKALFLDLDIVIVDSIDEFFTYSDKFSIIENWTQMGRGIGNSSVYCFTIGAHADVLDYYHANMEEVLTNYSNEQIYLSKKIGDIDFWPASWCKSYKRHCIPKGVLGRYLKTPKAPKDVKIVVFHGRPHPDDAIVGGFYGSFYKYARPAKWIDTHWR